MAFAIAAVNVEDNDKKLYLHVVSPAMDELSRHRTAENFFSNLNPEKLDTPSSVKWSGSSYGAHEFHSLDNTKWWWENHYKHKKGPLALGDWRGCFFDYALSKS